MMRSASRLGPQREDLFVGSTLRLLASRPIGGMLVSTSQSY